MLRYLPEGKLIDTPDNKSYISSVAGLEKALIEGKILEARVLSCDNEGNLRVDVGENGGIIPKQEAIAHADGEIKGISVLSRVGRPVCFRVKSIAENGPVILSRRAVQEEAEEALFTDLLPGDIIPARVTHLESFGAFVDVGCGIISLINIESISVSRIAHPSNRFTTGDDIFAIVKSTDKELRRIFLSHKELLGTWSQNAELFCTGETVTGIVRNVERYGLFIELTPNLCGLSEYKEGFKPGDHVAVYIKAILHDRMKIKLVIIDTITAANDLAPPIYFIREGRLNTWTYSPPGARRAIVSEFGGGV